MPHYHHHHHHHHHNTNAIIFYYMIRLLLFHLLLLLLLQIPTSQSLKHTFTVKHDSRHFIGPIGTPFGFNANGVYKLKVSNFQLESKSSSTDSPYGDLEGILYPGFLLKRFDSKQDFARFQDPILDNPNICGFQEFLDEDFVIPFDDNTFGDDDDNDDNTVNDNDDNNQVAHGPGVVDGGADGIFLSMLNAQEMWKPNTPSLKHFFHTQEAGYYVLFYQICVLPELDPEKAKQSKLIIMFQHITSTFQLDLEHTNVDMFGKVSYLTAGEMILPHLFLYISISYAVLLVVWKRLLHNNNSSSSSSSSSSHSNKIQIYAIHHLMTLVLALKTASIFFESVRYHYIRIHGHAELWSFVYYFLNFVKGTFLFTVILLMGSGWSFFQPVLGKKQSIVIFIVFFLQIINNVALVVLTHETMGERWYNQWSNFLHIVDIISCGAILIPIVWQVNALEERLEEEGIGQSQEQQSQEQQSQEQPQSQHINHIQSKLAIFRSFYILVVAYIYYTRIVVYIVASTLTYKYTWVKDLMTELGTLFFYVSVGMQFAPNALQETKYRPIYANDDNCDLNRNTADKDTATTSNTMMIELSQR